MKELLDSDRVNYLVWRFLLESNYRETAAHFQKEWHVQAPHRQFDFAPHVKNYALVVTLNKGLVYEDLERQHARRKQAPRDVQATAEAPETGVFGPLIPEPEHNEDGYEEDDQESEEIQNARKRPVDDQHHSASGGSSLAKRQRLSAGHENGSGVDSATDPMEIDHATNNNNHAYPSPLEGDRAISPMLQTDGPEKAVQVDNIVDLTKTTTFLRLAGDHELTVAPGEVSPVQANENPIVLHCEWNPREPAILAAAGTDALARIWTVPHATPDTSVPGHVDSGQRPFHTLIDDDVSSTATVSALSWNWDGTAIAIATEIGNRARISIWSADGMNLHRLDGGEPPIIKLRWSPNNALILGIAPEKKGTLVTIYPAASASSISYYLTHDLYQDPLEATWISETEFILCGGDLLVSLRCTEEAIVPSSRNFDTHADEKFSDVHFDSLSKLLATSSEKGTLDIWDESGHRRTINAHVGPIICLQWQPLQSSPQDDERLIATGGEDNSLCIWDARTPANPPKYTMNMGNPVLAMAFTPDGLFLAAATAERILVWKVGESTLPRANWSRAPHPGWFSPRSNSDQEDEDTHTLCWDATGRRLAYAANSRLPIGREKDDIDDASLADTYSAAATMIVTLQDAPQMLGKAEGNSVQSYANQRPPITPTVPVTSTSSVLGPARYRGS